MTGATDTVMQYEAPSLVGCCRPVEFDNACLYPAFIDITWCHYTPVTKAI